MKKIDLGKKETIHFIGIGGIGMSGLAQIMKIMGFKIQGSDLNKNTNTENCKKLGVKIYQGHQKKNLSKSTIVVKSSAIKSNNPEIQEAKKRKLPIYDRASMLANIISLKKNIIITGSHGKTTTTSLVAKILSYSKLDPTIINGGVINSIKNNARFGKGDWAVIEADESDGSFLKLPINYSIVTNLDYEHLDFYKNFRNLEKAFEHFVRKTPPIGKAIICADDKNLINIIKKIKTKNYLTYGFSKKANYQVIKVLYKQQNSRFDIRFRNENGKLITERNIVIKLLGKHNILNALAAISVCLNLGLKFKNIKNALLNYSGVERRMTKLFSKGHNEFYDDYAHHPTEIKSILDGVKAVSKKRKIISIFQPHRYSRVKNLKLKFANSFLNSDVVVLCPIYAAGEKKDKSYDQYNFSKLISKYSKTQVVNISEENDLTKFLKKNLINDEIIIGMGAGTISKWMKGLKQKL
ncbi:UDP-N-acetylmuramate--alanine ligase [SAR11 cluster bacterium PRT-SC02]|nr:UDP-N-acetylmuramate--alanine ligase [SAR11 cluster bacterium PRT-SC02]